MYVAVVDVNNERECDHSNKSCCVFEQHCLNSACCLLWCETNRLFGKMRFI